MITQENYLIIFECIDKENLRKIFDLDLKIFGLQILARVFAAFELKMNIISSSEEQKLRLESDCQEMLSKHGLVDHMLIERLDGELSPWGISLLIC